MNTPIWQPSVERSEASNLRRFIVANRERLRGDDYAALYDWSVAQPAEFWAAVWQFCEVRASRRYDTVLRDGARMPGAKWFEGARLNFAENLLEHDATGAALIFANERGERAELEWDELRAQVASVAARLRALGVGKGDRVAAFIANRPEAVVAMLATASIGAVWSSCSPDFGVDAVLDRFGQIEPKVLFVTDGYFYNGKTIDSLPTVRAVAAQLQGLAAVVVVPYLTKKPDVQGLPNAQLFATLLEQRAELRYEAVAFDDPLYILYSSGTTGVPKCIVHGVGGTLLQHRKEHALHTDIRAGDVVFYFTTCGWMMWNWLVTALASQATLVLYDGAPLHPDPGILWRLAERERISVFGTSAKYLSALEKAGFERPAQRGLPALRSILSTGSPLAPSSFDYVYRSIKADVQLASIAGGTDLISCFALGNPLLPVYRGELQCRGLGMRVEIFTPDGRPVREQKGELVCTAPFPSMPIGFWNDVNGRKYRAAYFERFANVWHHGDYAELTAHDGIVIYGRSDAILNPGGVRIGTAEIYRIVEQFAEVAESIVVGQEWGDDTRVVLFVRLQPGATLDSGLERRLREAIKTKASPRHVPAKILAVADIPRTMNGKIVELAVREAIHGRPIGNRDALANPQALEHFVDRPELKS
ncbi:MAG TPA: acetoacetate--CoA ligase [Gammaproteobacteria bacterium]|nr:acetoacetate--CoA ligase [Gammaproteobacteria bacterium]